MVASKGKKEAKLRLQNNFSQGKEPIRGWLIWIGIGVWAAPFLSGLLLLGSILNLLLHIGTSPRGWIQAGVGLVVFSFSIPVLRLFLKRKLAFVKLYLTYQAVYAILETVLVILNVFEHQSIVVNVMGYVEIVILSLYVSRSQRVKRTFVYF